MFTGIVEAVGRVRSLRPQGAKAELVVEAPEIAAGVRIGDSVAVNGACLTVTAAAAGALHFEAVQETLDRTSLGRLAAGRGVNLERALRADGRLDGHLVQGHVDGVGRVRELRRKGDDVRLYVTCDAAFADLLVEKGSVAIEGVSLTVVGVEREGFDVALIPHTLGATTLGTLEPGALVNLEADVLGKYVKRYLERILPGAAGRPGAA
ncbi:MAG TPA: riboflavin synthase [Myxococcota bacterium]|nr:riboflavin synthase [Myxococcota bacterium]